MYKLGLTGGIGSGKSTAAKYFQQKGAVIFDADIEAKKLITNNNILLWIKRSQLFLFI